MELGISYSDYNPDTGEEQEIYTTVHDTIFFRMINLWYGDTTLHLIDRNVGVSSIANTILPDGVQMKLDDNYLASFINRIYDYRDNRAMIILKC